MNISSKSISIFGYSTLISGMILYWYKPSIMFDSNGIPKKLSLDKINNEAPGDLTMLPWWLAALLIGGIAASSENALKKLVRQL